MYDVIAYKNTGFNAVNIPDTPALLTTMTSVELDNTDFVQNRWISAVNVRANWETIKDVDYCKIGDMFYSVANITMLAVDVARLTLIPDFITSCGGIDNVTILDGVTERHHLATNTLFGNVEPDPMLGATQPLQVEFAGPFFVTDPDGKADIVVTESTLKLTEMATNTTADEYTTAAGGTVAVPTVISVDLDDATVVSMTTPDGEKVTETPQTQYFSGSGDDTIAGIQKARALGLEGGIIGQFVLPGAAYASYGAGPSSALGSLVGSYLTQSSGLKFEYGTATNKRVYAGDANKYVISSPASGNTCEFEPEDIYNSGDSSPSVFMTADPRREGRPYFRFVRYKGMPWYVNTVSGMQWQTAPLMFTTKSGSEIDAWKFNTQTEQQISKAGYETLNMKVGEGGSGFTGAMKGLLGIGDRGAAILTGAGFATGGFAAMALNPAGNQRIGETAIDAALHLSQGDLTQYEEQLRYSSSLEAYDYGVGQSLVTPQINFPRSETIRDFVGNGIYVYRYRYTDTDLALNDKKLTMYGEKHTAPLEKSFFTNRTYFNYIKTNGISFGGSLAMYLREGLAAQLSNGVRIWHVKPDPSYYTTGNPIKEG